MSTHDESEVTFSVVPEAHQHHFRLLELPSELLDWVTSDHPPPLYLKSREGASGRELDSHAVLCTSDKTYNLRQVNHSNSVYVTLPTTLSIDDRSEGAGVPRIEAIAHTTFTLEPSAAIHVSAVPYLKAAVAIYTSTSHFQDSKPPRRKHDVFANIPLSDAECEQAWIELACFELTDSRACYLPSAGAKVQAWKSILTQATASGIDLTVPLPADQVNQVVDMSEEWPAELSRAVFRSFLPATDSDQIDDQRCARLVGMSLLESRCQGSGTTEKTSFVAAWKELLPEKWRSGAVLDVLKHHYTVDGSSLRMDSQPSQQAETKSTLGAKRKWHEKFRASKKTTD